MAFTEEKKTIESYLDDRETENHQITWKGGGELLLEFQHPDGPGASGTPIDLALLDASSNVVATWTVRGNTELQTTVSDGGPYYLKVSDGNASSSKAPGNYSIQTTLRNESRTTYDGAANNTVSTALDSPLENVIRGRLEAYETDVFKWKPETGGVFELRFAHPKSLGGHAAHLHLTDAQGKTVLSESLGSNGTLLTTVPPAATIPSVSVRPTRSTPACIR